MKKAKNDSGWYNYTATGTLEKTEPNRTPTQFVVIGRVNEKWSINGKTEGRKGKSSVLIPEIIEKSTNFLGKIPLGTKVRFRESSHRNEKFFSHSFSIEIIEKL